MITDVAIIFKGKTYSLPKPNRHHHVIHMICETTGVSTVDETSQGFLDDSGEFLDRTEAMKHAIECVKISCEDILFSEDVW